MTFRPSYIPRGMMPSGSVTPPTLLNRDQRYEVRLRARARQSGIELSVTVSNLSRSGCKLESLMALDPKTPVYISHKGYPTITAQIMWSKTGSSGCKFAEPIPDKILQEIVSGR